MVKILNEEGQKSQIVSASLFRNEIRKEIQQLVIRVSDGIEYHDYGVRRCDNMSFCNEV